MKSIYDMMGKYTYPTMQDDAPREHVESFFQVVDEPRRRVVRLLHQRLTASLLPVPAENGPE